MRAGVLHHLASDAWLAVRRAGLGNTLRIIASTVRDARFDRVHGTDTAGYADPRHYAAGDPRAHSATFYVATRARPFLDFLRHCRVPAVGTFVDFGAGKGRAMLLAAEYGFRRVIGIEFSPDLCAVAQRNIERFRGRVPETAFELRCGDAAEYAVGNDDRVFYFYDPFADPILERCLDHVAASLARSPREIAIIYHNSFAARPMPFERRPWLAEVPTPRFAGNAFYLFRSVSPA